MGWDTGDVRKTADSCGWAEEYRGAVIWITLEIQAVIRKLCDEIKDEWQALLTGVETKKGVWVSGYWIPKQEVTGATVTNLDIVDKEVIATRKIVCTIHSHSNMPVFFSATDEEFTNYSLIKNHIVCNNKGAMKATMRYELPCDMIHFFDSDVKVITPEISTIEGLANITKKVFKSQGHFPEYDLSPEVYGWSESEKNWNTDGRKIQKGKAKNKNRNKNKRKYQAHTLEQAGPHKNEHGVIIYP